MISTILIANRGEIACRIIESCRRLGLGTVAIYSEVDAGARHVALADTAVFLGPAPAAESYLNSEAIIEAAQRTGADAIHPGYGFLAENADFARACAQAGLIFIGPTPEAIAAMGNKRAARELVAAAGVPIMPGYDGAEQENEHFYTAAAEIGYPVMVKAAAGGGGKGMRLVTSPDDLVDALAAARREAQQAFGSDDLLLEKALVRPRHIEVQIIGDQQGQIIHLGERECSIQRRHQKVLEEAPAPALSAELRQQLGETAVLAAQTIHYTNAGTVEFLLDAGNNFYFLEMNTRLQVEHPVTEQIAGLDLVAWQIKVADGEPLPLAQAEVVFSGHAIEARLYAENPANDFLPVTGQVALWQPPVGEGVRVDHGLQTGDEVSIYYDPLLAKLIAHGPDRKTAVHRLRRALNQTALLGLTTNLPFLRQVVAHPAFEAGELHTGFLTDYFPHWQPPAGTATLPLLAATIHRLTSAPQIATNSGYWRNNPHGPQMFPFGLEGQVVEVGIVPVISDQYLVMSLRDRFAHSTQYSVLMSGEWYEVEVVEWVDGVMVLAVAGVQRQMSAVFHENRLWVDCCGQTAVVEYLPRLPRPDAAAAAGSLRAPMPGSILAVLVEIGQRVNKGQPLLKLEAMKMEHTIRAPVEGVVTAVYYAPTDTVAADAELIRLEPT
jgi:acetyl-CoA carboxylase biotin carboxylase subunit